MNGQHFVQQIKNFKNKYDLKKMTHSEIYTILSFEKKLSNNKSRENSKKLNLTFYSKK